MKKLIILAILASSSAFGQKISISPFYSVSLGKNEAKLKDKIGPGLAIHYDLNENCGFAVQVNGRESWTMNARIDRFTSLRTYSLQFFVFQETERASRWYFRPAAGILAGWGTPIKTDGQNPAALRESLQLLDHPYFFGVILEAGVGYKLSEKFSLELSLKEEGTVGQITNRPAANENFTTISNASFRAKLGFNL